MPEFCGAENNIQVWNVLAGGRSFSEAQKCKSAMTVQRESEKERESVCSEVSFG